MTLNISAIAPLIREHYTGDPEKVIRAVENGQAFVFTKPTGFAVVSDTVGHYGDKELFVWVVVGMDIKQYQDDLKSLAKDLDCVRLRTRIDRKGLARLLPRWGWSIGAMDLVMEV